MRKELRSRSVALWFSKNLGVRCLRYLLHNVAPKYPEFEISQLYLSQRDEASLALKKLADQFDIPVTIIPDAERSDHQRISQSMQDCQENCSADLGLIVGFPHCLPADVINSCAHGVINLHFAPLPKYRGSGTLIHAIANQEKEYGVTFHYIDPQLDTGPVIAVTTIPLDLSKDMSELVGEFEDLAYTFFVEYIEQFLTEETPAISQDVLCIKQRITPIFCTRASAKKLLATGQTFRPDK